LSWAPSCPHAAMVKKLKKRKAEAVAEPEALEPEPVRKLKKRKVAAPVVDEPVAEKEPVSANELPVKRKLKKKKKKASIEAPAAKVEVVAAREEPPAELKKKKKKKKLAAPVVVQEPEESSSDEQEEAQKPVPKTVEMDSEDKIPFSPQDAAQDLEVFVGGIPFSCDEETVRKDFGECGEIVKLSLPLNEEGKPKGFAFITYTTNEAVVAACKFDGEDYGGRKLRVNVAGLKGKGDKGKGKDGKDKGKDGKGEKGKGKGRSNNELTAFVRGLPYSTTEDMLRKDFSECGEIESLRMLLNEDGQCKGIAFIEYKEAAGLEKAKEFNETDYGGRTVYVVQAGEGGKGKDGKGKDGKGKDGKGKDGKGKDGKGKDGKGKDGKGKGKDKGKKGKDGEGQGNDDASDDS